MTNSMPKNFAGLAFSVTGTGPEAIATEGFWSLWRHDANALRALGFRPKKRNEGSKAEYWIVTWAAGKIAVDVVDRAVQDLQLALFAAQRNSSDHVAEVARRNREITREQDADRELRVDAARVRLVERFGDLADTDLVASAQSSGRACWQQWRSFCVSKKRLLELSAVDARISVVQAAWLIDLVYQTTVKAECVRENLKAGDNEVDWPDADVVRAVESLCWSDTDQAREENGQGWSKADTSKGHWCAGMIKMGGANRSIGIDAARAIVGKYSRQLGRAA